MTGLADYLEYSSQGITRRKFLREQMMMQEHNLLCYSRNLLLLDPNHGYEKQWEGAREQVQLLTQMLNELPDEHGCCTFIGRIMDWVRSDTGWFVKFEVASPEGSLKPASLLCFFKITEELVQKWKHTYDEAVKERTAAELPTLVKAKVKKADIYDIEWVDQWD